MAEVGDRSEHHQEQEQPLSSCWRPPWVGYDDDDDDDDSDGDDDDDGDKNDRYSGQ